MKKILILALALFLNTTLSHAFTCDGQNKRCTEYFPATTIVKAKYKLKNGKIEGTYKEFYKNKIPKIVAKYENGLLEGEYLAYYDNAQLQTKEYYKEGTKHGVSYLYNTKGKLLNSTSYYYDKKQGYSYDFLENIKLEKYYDDDELVFEKEFAYDGTLLKEKRYFKNGDVKTTEYFYFDISDKIQEIINSISDRGKLVEVYKKTNYMALETLASIKDEKIIITASFYNDSDKIFYSYRLEKTMGKIKTAKLCDFTDYGEPISEAEFTNYLKNMKFILYHSNGNVASIEHFIENPKTKKVDFKDGTFYTFNTNGNMTSKRIYKNDKEIDGFIWNYHPNGNYSYAGRVKNGEANGIQTLYYDNGKVEIKSNFLNGKLHGTLTKYDYEGNTIYIENYLNGALNGQKTEFYRNGNKKATLNYKNDKLEGTIAEYWENGRIKTKGAYINNKATGYWVTYNKKGIREEECNYKNDKKYGTATQYWENGTPAYIDTYEAGVLKSRRAFNVYGKELWSQKY